MDDSAGREESALRLQARRRSWVWIGAGYALLGYGRLGRWMFFLGWAFLATFAWLAIRPSAAALVLFLIGLVLIIILAISEQIAVRKIGRASCRERVENT